MGEFHDAVETLLQAFTNGLAILRSIRRRRKEDQVEIKSGVKKDELRLRKSLKKNRADVQNAYATDLAKVGRGFSDGDVKSQSSLASILFRLNAGYVNIIDRFTRGESTRTDYHMLVNLSNASRIEAMRTFEQLSLRLSRSSLGLSENPERERHGTSKKQKKESVACPSSTTGGASRRYSRSKSASKSSVKQTMESSTTSQALVLRPKAQKKASNRQKLPSKSQQDVETHSHLTMQDVTDVCKVSMTTHQSNSTISSTLTSNVKQSKRVSVMSFASDSTKIGEIPERHPPRPPLSNSEVKNYFGETAFPLTPWTKPDKPRSRFLRLFRKEAA